MNAETFKFPWDVEVNDIILRHPHHPEPTGEWRVIGDPKIANGGVTTIPYDTGDGDHGANVFAVWPEQMLSVRPATTYRVHPLLTESERTEALTSATERERTFLLAQVIHRFPEIFDDAYARLQTARAAGAAALREDIAS